MSGTCAMLSRNDSNSYGRFNLKLPEHSCPCAAALTAGDARAAREVFQALRDLADWLYLQLEREWEYQSSDECVDEGIVANDYTFTETGRRFG